MNWKKNRFSYFLWLIYTTVVGIGILGIASIVCTKLGFISDYGLLTGGGYLLCAGMLVLCLRKMLVKKKFGGFPEGMPTLIAENVVVLVLFAVGIVLRVMHISNMTGLGEDSYFFELAKVTDGQEVPQNAHGATYLYLKLLHIVLLLFGNKIAAAVWLQFMLQMLAIILLYLAVRRLAGRMTAVILLGFVMCAPYMVEQAVTLSPTGLFLVVYGLVLCCIAANLQKHDCKPWRYLLVGAAIGSCCYLDIAGVTLLALAGGVISVEREEPDTFYNKGGMVFLFYGLGCVVTVLSIILLNSVFSGSSIMDIFGAWGRMYQPEGFLLPASLYQVFLRAEGIILLGVLGIGIFCYGRREEYERQSIWQCVVIVLMVLQCFQMTHPHVDASICVYIILAVLAGVGIEGIFIMDNKPKHFVDELEEKLAKEEALKREEALKKEGTLKKEEALKKEGTLKKEEGLKKEGTLRKEEGLKKEGALRKEEGLKKERSLKKEEALKKEEIVVENLDEAEAPVEKEKAAENEKPKVKYLDNPLPLPKKHVPKVMDYKVKALDFKNEYEFDIPVSDDDDFDI